MHIQEGLNTRHQWQDGSPIVQAQGAAPDQEGRRKRNGRGKGKGKALANSRMRVSSFEQGNCSADVQRASRASDSFEQGSRSAPGSDTTSLSPCLTESSECGSPCLTFEEDDQSECLCCGELFKWTDGGKCRRCGAYDHRSCMKMAFRGKELCWGCSRDVRWRADAYSLIQCCSGLAVLQ